MHVTDYSIGMAVLKEFRDNRVFHAGGSLLLSSLSAGWTATGLRDRDLPKGIEWLSTNRCLKLEPYPATDDVLVTLLPEGAERLTQFPHKLKGWFEEARGELILRAVARRRTGGEFLRRARASLHGFHPDFENTRVA